MDATYNSDLRDLNGRDFARFERIFAAFEARMLRWMFAFWATQMLVILLKDWR